MEAAEFNRRMAALPEPPLGEWPEWDHWRHALWELGRAEDPDGFMGWPAVYHTMLVNHWDVTPCYRALAREAPRWLRAAWQPEVGSPQDSFELDGELDGERTPYSRNLIVQAHQVLRFERWSGRRVSEFEAIVEVGGGYGAMALVMRRLGFMGEYTILDLPEFSLLQEWFLGQVRVPARLLTRLPRRGGPCDLLVGLYSLSEMGFGLRERTLAKWRPRHWLLGFTGEWNGLDNRRWFREWRKRQAGAEWRLLERPEWRGAPLLLGRVR